MNKGNAPPKRFFTEADQAVLRALQNTITGQNAEIASLRATIERLQDQLRWFEVENEGHAPPGKGDKHQAIESLKRDLEMPSYQPPGFKVENKATVDFPRQKLPGFIASGEKTDDWQSRHYNSNVAVDVDEPSAYDVWCALVESKKAGDK